jgi:hypothetical protein
MVDLSIVMLSYQRERNDGILATYGGVPSHGGSPKFLGETLGKSQQSFEKIHSVKVFGSERLVLM